MLRRRIEPSGFAHVLDYGAPFLLEKLVADRNADTLEEANSLFMELKRYFLLVHVDNGRSWELYSFRIDAVWHQFILFTREYIEFCDNYFGGYIPHSPSNAPEYSQERVADTSTFGDFQSHYLKTFGKPLPDIWFDERTLTVDRHIVNDGVDRFNLHDRNGMIEVVSSTDELLLSISEIARDALYFAMRTRAFYVRELPGNLTTYEKIAIAASLIQCKLLRTT